MSKSHPYISGPNNISKMINHLRKAFPATVNADTIKKLGLAPQNESYLINALHFVGIIDENGTKTGEAKSVFSSHIDEDFHSGFSQLVKIAYSDLFELHGDSAWTLSKDRLIGFFRQSDETSATIGSRQASTFQVFAAMSGYGALPSARAGIAMPKPRAKPDSNKNKASASNAGGGKSKQRAMVDNGDFSLTVRVEINLPSDGSKETYDSIFKSIKENLLNGN